MNIEEAKLYLEHTSKDDFNLEEWQKENRYQAIQVVLKEIERLHSIINKAINKTKDIEFSITGKDFNYYLKLKDIEQGKELLQILKGSDKE